MQITLRDGSDKRRVFIAAVGLLLMIALGLLFATRQALGQEAIELSSTYQQVTGHDPDNPTAQYVLGKLNQHLIVNAQNMDEIRELKRRMVKQEDIKAGEHFVKEDTDISTIKWLLMTVVAGVITILLKDVFSGVKITRRTDEIA